MTPQETYETMARVLGEMDPIAEAVEALFAEDERDRHRRHRPIQRCRACGGRGHVRSWMRFGYILVECSLCLGNGR